MTTSAGPWPSGMPCWADIMVSDIDRTRRFYGGLLGWDFAVGRGQRPEYLYAMLDGQEVAGLYPRHPGPDARSMWSAYLATDDIGATCAAVREAGGSLVVAPRPVGPLGTMAVCIDPLGASFGLWQADELVGFGVRLVDGGLAWCELLSPRMEASQDFYARTLGYEYTSIGLDGSEYLLFRSGGSETPGGGIVPLVGGHTAQWFITWQHDDIDAAAGRIVELGGRVITAPYDFEFGRLMRLSGPDGEEFGLVTFPDPV